MTCTPGCRSQAYIDLLPGAEHNSNTLEFSYKSRQLTANIDEMSIPYKRPF